MHNSLQVLTTDIGFGEAPRWRNGLLWFSDIKAHAVKTISPQGELNTVLKLDCEPSGLGWLPDGSLLIVSMLDHRLLRYDGKDVHTHADLSAYCGGKLNDLVVDVHGHAFASNMGFDYHQGDTPCTTDLLRVDSDGSISIAASDIWCPNGMAITADGQTLLVGQSASTEVLAFDLAADGSLANRRVYVQLPQGCMTDGMCIDKDGAVWIASPISNEFMRLTANGDITDRVSTGSRHAIACMLGGADRRTLFCMTAAGLDLSVSMEVLSGQIETLTVAIPGAGWP
jgi:sugar lactone lactonase YvrE